MAGKHLIGPLLLSAGLAVAHHLGTVPAAVSNDTPQQQDDSAGIEQRHTLGPGITNPHGDLVFRATGASSCRDCHRVDREVRIVVLDNAPVRTLIAKGRGNHGPGRFADCFRCHAGGTKGIGIE